MNEKHSEKVNWLSPLVSEDGFGVQFRDDHVHVQLGKDFEGDPAKRDTFWGIIGEACKRHQTSRILVEGFVPSGERDTADVIDAGQKTAVVPRLWLAFALSDFKPTDQTELYEVIAAAKGVRVKFFSDARKALEWLRVNSPQ